MKTYPSFFCRFLLVFFLVLPGIHSDRAQGAAANANAVEGIIGGCTCSVLMVVIGGSVVLAWLFPTVPKKKLEQCMVSLRSLQTENEAKDHRMLGCEESLKSLQTENGVQNKRMLGCEENLKFLQAETEVRGTGILECKENLKSLRAENEARNISMLECEANQGALQAEAESLRAVTLECQKNLSSLQAEVEAGDMEVFLPLRLGQLEQISLDIALGIFLPLLARSCFNPHFFPRVINTLLSASFMVGVTHLIYGISKILIISGGVIYEAYLTGSVWQASEASNN